MPKWRRFHGQSPSGTHIKTVNYSSVAKRVGITKAVTFSAVSGSGILFRGNEPLGMTMAIERPFDSVAGAFIPSGHTLTVVSDATAPYSPPHIMRGTILAGTDDQTSVYLFEDGTDDFDTVYICYWARYSANWEGHPTGVNKEFYFWTNGDTPSIYFDANGGGDGELIPQLETQGAVSTPLGAGEVHLIPNLVPGVRIIRNQWQLREVILKANTSGHTDGSCDVYIDNSHVASYGSIQWRSGASVWNLFRQNSFWGGNAGATVSADQWIDIDHMYVSGK